MLDLATLTDHPLAETRNVDDQAAWLDNTHVAYGVAQRDGTVDTWSARSDGTGYPALLIPTGESPVPVPVSLPAASAARG